MFFACVHLSLCLLERLLKNACMDFDKMLRVDRCRDMDELITGSALALHCCKTHEKSIGKSQNSTPRKIVTHEDFNLKLGTRDYVVDTTHHATFGTNRLIRGFPPNA